MKEVTATLRPLQRFFRLLNLDKRDIYYVYLYAILSGVIALSLPLGVQAIIGLIAGGTLSASLIILVLIVTAGTAFSGVLKVMQLRVTETLQRRIFTRSAFDFSYRLPSLKLDSMVGYHAPELVNRFFDTLTLQKGVPKIIMDLSTAVLQILFGILLISFYHPFFVFFGVFLVLILIALLRFTGPKGLKTSLKESKYKYEVAYWLEEIARSMSTFKLCAGTSFALSKTDDLVSNYLDSRREHFKVLLFQYNIMVAFKTIFTAGLLLLGGYLVIENRINIGQFVAAEIVVILVMASVEKLIVTMEVVYDVLTAIEKLGAVTDLPLEPQGGVKFDQIHSSKGVRIVAKDLKFQFEDSPTPTLEQINFDIKPGEKVCIAGYNRSGKSTLVQLLAGLYVNFEGSITYNGYPLRNLDLSSLRKFTGDFSAYEDIFKGSILENISMGRSEAGLDEVIAAVHSVGLNDYIERLPKGYNTQLLPEGKNVPESIRTRILLARCILSKPQLLVLQGAFAGLEQADRESVATFLTDNSQPWTMLAVSDDPILASRCDRVLIMKEGRIIEEGAFDGIKLSPHYAQVFSAIAQ